MLRDFVDVRMLSYILSYVLLQFIEKRNGRFYFLCFLADDCLSTRSAVFTCL